MIRNPSGHARLGTLLRLTATVATFVAALSTAWTDPGPQPAPGITLNDAPSAPSPAQVAALPRNTWQPFGVALLPINTASRESVRNHYHAIYRASSDFSVDWTGAHANCTPGSTSPALKDLVLLRVNYYRAMAGVPAGISLQEPNSLKNQQAALMMSANNKLSHFPTNSWTCYTEDGYDAAGSSNLALGSTGPDSIDGYMDDFGTNNFVVGHRRWVLYPQTQLMGTGDVPATNGFSAANSLWVFDGHYSDPRPTTRDGFVAWPPPGYVPYPVVYQRWSCSYPLASFAAATVTVTRNGVPLNISRETVQDGAGENTLVWYESGAITSGPNPWPKPDADTTYNVDIRGVTVGGRSTNFTYSVVVFDPETAGPDTVLAQPQGSTAPAAANPASYSFATVPAATSYEWRRTTPAPSSTVEGWEAGTGNWTTRTSPGYDILVSSPTVSGQRALHLAHPAPPASQHLTYTHTLCPRAGATLSFYSRLGYATPDQTAQVSVSTDEGISWQTLFEQTGTGNQGETSYALHTLPLADYENRSVTLRFSYLFASGNYYGQTNTSVGWLVDDVSWTNTEELTDGVIASAGPGSFTFTPPAAGPYALQVRGVLYNQFPLEWGPALRVVATTAAPPILQPPTTAGGNLHLSWTQGTGPFYLDHTPTLTPPAWTQVAGPIISNATSLPLGSSLGFYRLRAN